MLYLPKSNFQNHPFHLVSPSPWPLYTSISLFILTTSTVLFMHSFQWYVRLVLISILNVIYSMSLWFRDVISEGKISFNYMYLKTASAICKEIIEKIKNDCLNKFNLKDEQFGYYLAGLFEGDGHLSLPFLGQTTLNRICFQRTNNTLRYIIGDIEGIKLFIQTINGKLRTPKNESFNKLIKFINEKYNLLIPFSSLDESELTENSWFTGFTEADGYFGVKIVEAKLKSNTRKRSVSNSISLKFRLDQRYLDRPSYTPMIGIMVILSEFLYCKLSIFENKTGKVLSLTVTALNKISFLVNYFNKYPLKGIKGQDFKDWEIIYNMMINKEHLTNEGREKIKLLQLNMNSKRKIELKYEI